MLKLYADVEDYKPWIGAVYTYDELYNRDLLDAFYEALAVCYPNGLSMTELNDILWFKPEFCYDLVGLEYDSENNEIID